MQLHSPPFGWSATHTRATGAAWRRGRGRRTNNSERANDRARRLRCGNPPRGGRHLRQHDGSSGRHRNVLVLRLPAGVTDVDSRHCIRRRSPVARPLARAGSDCRPRRSCGKFRLRSAQLPHRSTGPLSASAGTTSPRRSTRCFSPMPEQHCHCCCCSRKPTNRSARSPVARSWPPRSSDHLSARLASSPLSPSPLGSR